MRWYSEAGVCVLPSLNYVMGVRTGAVFSVLPDSQRGTMSARPLSARVKQIREKNCAGSR